MNRSILAKLIGRWLLLMISVPLGLLWLNDDLNHGSLTRATLKLLSLLGMVALCDILLTHAVSWKRAKQLRTLEQFAAALPFGEKELPENGPQELEPLARSMRAMSQRVRTVVERANLESSRREAILSCMAEGVLAVDEGMKVVFCNDTFASVFSTCTPAPEGKSLYEVVREPDLRYVLERVVQSGEPEGNRFQLPTAASRWFEARAVPLASTPRHGAVIVLHDITDIQHQEQMRKDFVADVSHELRTPLTAIRGYAETLLDGALEDAENNRKFVEIILSHTIRLNNIASDLLVLSELDSDQRPPSPLERIGILEVIDSALHTVEHAAQSRDITLHRGVCRELHVSGYRFRLEQVFVNLLDNAVKFNRDHGNVQIECVLTPDNRISTSVADTGIGIPSSDLKRIFERFYRVDKARSRPGGGTGLGLPIVKEVIETMGGSIQVESQLGRGSKFTVVLPAA